MNEIFQAERGPGRADALISRRRFLDAADRVFIREGYDRATIRAITAEAKTSLARLNRHWTGKEHLFRETLERHFDAIHSAQNRGFDALEAEGPAALGNVERVLEAFLTPALRGLAGSPDESISHQVYARALTDTSPEVLAIIRPLVAPVRQRLAALLRASLPDLDADSFFLALTIVLGAYTYPQINGARLAASMNASFKTLDWNRAGPQIARMLAFGLGSAASD